MLLILAYANHLLMSLTKFLEREKLKAAELARIADIPNSSISQHLKYEATNGEMGRPLGIELSLRAIKAYANLKLDDLRPDWAERLEGCQHG